ncbi:hypothetical protein, partial [Shinella sp.]|uniref:hypothetical protein n=1 Tax=Shinella sp. TaxID=1870904 RepID=UPI003F6FA781
SCGFPLSVKTVSRIPAFPPLKEGRRYAESSDVLQYLPRISDWRRSIRAIASPEGSEKDAA